MGDMISDLLFSITFYSLQFPKDSDWFVNLLCLSLPNVIWRKKKSFFKTSHYSTSINAFGPVTLLCKTGCLPCPWQKMQCCSLITFFFFVKSINVLFRSGVSIIFIIGKNTTFKIHLNLTSQLKGKNLLSIWLCQQIKTIGNKAISGKWSPLKKVSQPKVTQFQIL